MASQSKKAKQAKRLAQEVEDLKKVRRRAILMFALAVLAIVVMALVRQLLVMQGVIDSGDTTSNTVIFVVSLGLCFILAPWSNTFIRSGRRIKELEQEIG